jgi:hypothetical protein
MMLMSRDDCRGSRAGCLREIARGTPAATAAVTDCGYSKAVLARMERAKTLSFYLTL